MYSTYISLASWFPNMNSCCWYLGGNVDIIILPNKEKLFAISRKPRLVKWAGTKDYRVQYKEIRIKEGRTSSLKINF